MLVVFCAITWLQLGLIS